MYKPDQYGSYRGYGRDLGKEIHRGSYPSTHALFDLLKRFNINYSRSGIWLNV